MTVFFIIEAVQSPYHAVVHLVKTLLILSGEDEMKADWRIFSGRRVRTVVVYRGSLREPKFGIAGDKKCQIMVKRSLLKGSSSSVTVDDVLCPP
jgi:hypothetical protein